MIGDESIDESMTETSSKCGNNAGLNSNFKSFNPFNAKAPVFKPFVPTVAPKPAVAKIAAPATSTSSGFTGLDSVNIGSDFTPSTPYVHKFRTEICKNFELYGKCKYGDEVSSFLLFR